MNLQTPKCKTNAQRCTCRNCEHRVTARFRVVDFETCTRWFHAKCVRISNPEYDMLENQFWLSSFCHEHDKTDINHSSETKVFLRYVDNIWRTVRGDTRELLDVVSYLHPNLQFALETTDDKKVCHFWTIQSTYNRRLHLFAHGIKNHHILDKT